MQQSGNSNRRPAIGPVDRDAGHDAVTGCSLVHGTLVLTSSCAFFHPVFFFESHGRAGTCSGTTRPHVDLCVCVLLAVDPRTLPALSADFRV